MAKIRVYELARQLNMKNKVLLEKLSDMNISVGSHMSSLEEETVTQIKATLLGTKAGSLEEVRVKPTVIRRRRKKVSKKPEEVEAVAPETDAPEAATEEAAGVETAAQPELEETPAPAEPEETPAPEADVPDKTAEAAEAAEAVETTVEPEAKDAPAATEADITAIPAAPAAPAPPPGPEPGPGPEKEPAAPATKAPAKKAAPKKAGAKKKKEKDAPAKIIKLPVAPVIAKPKPAAARTAASGTAPAAESGQVKKKKGFKKRGPEESGDKKFFKKKISFRRKSIVEGDALYSRSARGRKGRKGAKGKASAPGQKTQITVAKAIKRRIKIDDTIILSDLAKRMGIKANEMIKRLMGMGVMATVNQTIDYDTAVLVAAEFEYEIERASFEEESIIKIEQDDPSTLSERPPVVTIMGHVDHGKTSLLDVIRQTSVTDGEAGGITQHIGAYHVATEKGQVVFLDTPGHEAFTAMRSRGAQVTDIVVLVVAADDGVMPQTVEAINHAKAAEVPIIVAVNKIDKANAEPDRVQRELSDVGLSPEDWGGDTIFVRVSAKEKTGISDLLEMIVLQSEFMELRANPDKLAVGHVVEAKLDSGRGAVATLLVQEGTLHIGDPVVCGVHYGKVRALINDRGQQVSIAGPSTPVEIIGLSGVPNAGDEMVSLKDEKDAKQVSLHRAQKLRSKELAKTSRLSLENLFDQMKQGEVKDLNIIIKADVHGSIEALADSLTKLSNDEVKINVVHSATGTISESDVSLAAVSDAIIIGFNVRPNTKVQSLAQEENVNMRFYNVIYNVIKDVQDAIVGMMASTFEEQVLGRAEVRQVFHVPKIGAIAGSYVTDGKLQRAQMVRLLRDGVIQYEGKVASLRRFKDDVKEVQSGYECGIGIENYNDIKVGDEIECFYLEEIKPKI
jgi:translation initiation factor IF-2